MLSTVITLALCAVATTAVARALAPFALLMRKPLSCDLCMAFWSGLAAAVVHLLLAMLDARLQLATATLLRWAIHCAGPTIGLAYIFNVGVAALRNVGVNLGGMVPLDPPDGGDSTQPQEMR